MFLHCKKAKKKEEIVTVDAPKRVDAPRSIEEILALLEKIRKKIREVGGKTHLIISDDVLAMLDDFVPKLEAFLKDHVGRAQLKKLIENLEKQKEKFGELAYEEEGKICGIKSTEFHAKYQLCLEVLERLEMLGK